jgi:hypothetical protein
MRSVCFGVGLLMPFFLAAICWRLKPLRRGEVLVGAIVGWCNWMD